MHFKIYYNRKHLFEIIKYFTILQVLLYFSQTNLNLSDTKILYRSVYVTHLKKLLSFILTVVLVFIDWLIKFSLPLYFL